MTNCTTKPSISLRPVVSAAFYHVIEVDGCAEFDEEHSDKSLERLGVGCVFVCMGWCGSE